MQLIQCRSKNFSQSVAKGGVLIDFYPYLRQEPKNFLSFSIYSTFFFRIVVFFTFNSMQFMPGNEPTKRRRTFVSHYAFALIPPSHEQNFTYVTFLHCVRNLSRNVSVLKIFCTKATVIKVFSIFEVF